MIEGSLEVKLLTIWTDGKAEVGRVREEKSRREKMQVREKVAKPRNTVFFQWFVAPGGRKVGSLKRRVRSHVARWGMRKCTPLWREAHFQVKMCTTHQGRTTFGSWDVEEVHAVVVRRTFPSQNVHHSQTTFGSWDVEKVHAVVAWSKFRSQNVKRTTCSDQFWTFRCRFAWPSCVACLCRVVSVFSDVTECAAWICQFWMFARHFRACLFWRYEVADGARCVRKQKGRKVELCTKGIVVEWFLTLLSFRSYTAAKTRFCSHCVVSVQLSNYLGKMKNQIDGCVKCFGAEMDWMDSWMGR